MADILLDTNIAIYVYGEHPTYLHFMRTIAGKRAAVSVMTSMEMAVGARDDSDARAIEEFLGHFDIIPVSIAIANASAIAFRKRKLRNLRHPWLADTIIGQTALSLVVPLATNNPKDFSAFTGLKIIVPE